MGYVYAIFSVTGWVWLVVVAGYVWVRLRRARAGPMLRPPATDRPGATDRA